MQRAQVGSRTGTVLPAAPEPPTGNPGYPPRLHAVEPSTTPRPCRKPLWMRCVRGREGTSRAHAPRKLHRPARTGARCFRWSTNIAPRNPRLAPHLVQSLYEWQDFSHRLHAAGHQPYCLVRPCPGISWCAGRVLGPCPRPVPGGAVGRLPSRGFPGCAAQHPTTTRPSTSSADAGTCRRPYASRLRPVRSRAQWTAVRATNRVLPTA
jgi:hypothetical protein